MFIKPASEDEGERDEQDGFISSERPQHRPACNGCRRPATALCQFSCLGRTRTDERPASRDGSRQRRSGTLIGDANELESSPAPGMARTVDPAGDEPSGDPPRTEPIPLAEARSFRTRLLFTMCQNRRTGPRWVWPQSFAFFLDIPNRRHLPSKGMVELVGIEPTTPCLQSRCSPS